MSTCLWLLAALAAGATGYLIGFWDGGRVAVRHLKDYVERSTP